MSRNLEPFKPVTIGYDKGNGDKSVRCVISVEKVPNTIKVVDVSDVSEEHTEEIAEKLKEYNEYFENHKKTAFNFEEWFEQVYGEAPSVKWRNFRLDRIYDPSEGED